ncbi:MAG: pantetheine-phosphate adenylyltransferase [Actinobacteria bacterium]|nr:pantetheine-phosphate adenylyltransferase [Actinomycetota bacterium]
MATALVPGSFNPVHLGHVRIVETVAATVERVVVAAVGNPNKPSELFDLDRRAQLLGESLAHLGNVEVVIGGPGLVVDLARRVGATVLVKGIRGVADLESESQMAHMNLAMAGIPTVFVPTSQEFAHLSSTLIREIWRLGGNVSAMVPAPVLRALAEMQEPPRS